MQVSTNANYTFTVTEAATYVAHFQIQSYTVSVSADPTSGGIVSGGGTYNYSQSCTVHATAATGYNFVNWTENGTQVSTDADYTFTVTNNRTLVAHFSTQSYTITATADPTAGGTVSGGGAYDYGQSCTLTATANPGYTFVNWTKDGTQVSTNANYTFTVTESATYVAHFQIQSYTVSVSADPTSGGIVSGGGTFNHGQSCTVHATAATGYNFVNWTENGTQVSTDADYTFTVTNNRTLVAHFSTQSYTITATADPTAGGTVNGGGAYDYGQSCTLTATANPGYTFINWTKDGTQVSTNTNYTFTVTEAATYVAHFQIQSYTVSVSADPTSGGIVSGGGTYNYGQSCTVHATAATGYNFVNWTENGTQVSTDADYTFTVTNNRTLVAHFSTQSYTITATADPTAGGTVSGGGAYDYGQSCTLTAIANQGYTFVNWTKDGVQVSTNATYTFIVTEAATYVAHFQIQSYTVSVSADPTSGGIVSGGGAYDYGQSCTLTATANPGYTFINWTKDGTQVSTNANYTFTVTEAATYVAHFQIQNYVISVSADPTEGGTVIGGGTFNYGDNCTLTATANEGFAFQHWTKDGMEVSFNPSYSFTVTETATFIAWFTKQVYTIEVDVDPSEGGIVSGGGTYNYGETCTISVIPNENYIFENWMENGIEVTTDTCYTFTVTGDRSFVAHLQFVDGVVEQDHVTVSLFPNPAKNKLTIEASEPIDLLEIYSINGALMYRQKNCNETMEINVKNYSVGTYLIRLTTNSKVETKKFVKK
jgi:uncharacterized repeat protein (TIGR02543 family)